ncbi:MAG: hypothetical protein FJ265_18920, partial [Planctomycetes bacterium]|nr:hypothetical protein [Planctomycetota bacterium]
MLALRTLLLAAAPGLAVPAQALEEMRDQLRQGLRSSGYGAFLGSMAGLAADGQLSLGTLDADRSGFEWTLFAMPWQRDFVASDGGPAWRIEATLGWSRAEFAAEDIWGGGQPGLETAVRAHYDTFAADLGAGPVLPLPWDLQFVPALHLGLAHLRSRADYRGPGAALSQALFDGILFGWDSTAGAAGGSFALQHRGLRAGTATWAPALRYDVRQVETLAADDPALDVSDTEQWLTVRLAGTGPIDRSSPDGFRWQLGCGYRRLLGRSVAAMEFTDFGEVGAGIVWPAPLPP